MLGIVCNSAGRFFDAGRGGPGTDCRGERMGGVFFSREGERGDGSFGPTGCCFDAGHAHLMAPAPGKRRSGYFVEMDWAWGNKIEEYPNAYERLAPHIVTCHLHDNDGYSDAHELPGTGTIDWKTLIPKLKKSPRLISMQTEVRTIPAALPVGKLCDTFRKLMAL